MQRILDILAALRAADVEYVVVGGVAVVLRGHVRTTVDLDLALDLTTDNVTRALEVLTAHGLTPRLPVPALQFADPQIRRHWVDERHLVAFTMHDPDDALTEVDLLASTPVPFAELAADSEWLTVGEVPVRVASLAHLIALKRDAARPQDLADIAALSLLDDARIVDHDGTDDG